MTSSVDRAIKKACNFQENGNILEAQAIYNKFLSQYPASQKLINAQKMLELGLSRKDLKGTQPSEILIDKLINLYEDGQYHKLADYTKWALSFYPKSPILYNLLGAASRGLSDFEEAIESFHQAKCLNFDDAETHNNLAISLKDAGRIAEAVISYEQAIKIKPDFFSAYVNLTYALKDIGEIDRAKENIKKALLLKPNDERAAFLQATLTGDTLPKSPDKYVETLFDNFATTFDHKLTEILAYNTPKTLKEEIYKNIKQKDFDKVLDLGCGTGLFGDEIRDSCKHLTGIDISKNMLSKAEEKYIYDELYHFEIEKYLATSALDFDLVCAADVFVYMGDLHKTMHILKSRNNVDFSIAFTTEHSDIGEYVLQSSGRYTHSRNYIENICSKLGYKLETHSIHPLRKEANTQIYGGLYILSSKQKKIRK